MIELKFLNAVLYQHESKPNLQLILSNILNLNIRMIFKLCDRTKEEDPWFAHHDLINDVSLIHCLYGALKKLHHFYFKLNTKSTDEYLKFVYRFRLLWR